MAVTGSQSRGLIGVVEMGALFMVTTFILLASPAMCRSMDGVVGDVGVGMEQSQELDLHPIDICIFSCDTCFKNEALVHCANGCIISQGIMDMNWRRICNAFQHLEHHH